MVVGVVVGVILTPLLTGWIVWLTTRPKSLASPWQWPCRTRQ